MKIIELESLDDSFFDDLREGNFILVLGAGFSYDVPNKAGGTIPIGEQFAQLTKKKFGLNYDLSYSQAAEVWEYKVKDKPELMSEFINLFLVEESKLDLKLYSSIFLPNWYNIFTLNFDNLLEITQEITQRRQMKIFTYPNDGADSEEPDILHLHGIIHRDSTSFDKIVFTPNSYRVLHHKINTPYSVLYGDVNTHKKNIIILGSQFMEDAVREKFFFEMTEDEPIQIYHFDIETKLEYVTEFSKRGYHFIQLNKKKGGTKQFLQFLLDNKDKIKNIQIEGTETINSTFVKKINEHKEFTEADFYTAKQDDDCQWYGVLKDFDIIRNDYPKIKTVAKNCFENKAFKKVAAVIYGNGGCGKSTLLRRLAIELHKEPFFIIWVKDRQFDDFVKKGLDQIKNDKSRNYLVIIEDWYRLSANENTNLFLANTETITNIRIIIGDREIAGKEYISHLYKFENQFPLFPEENEKIINDILNKFEDWKPVADNVLKNNVVKSTPLFLLLFVIARINVEKFGAHEIDFTNPTSAFRDIIKSDLKKINNKFPGLAKALHIWACFYSNYKIHIDFSSFLKIADYYNNNSLITENFLNEEAVFPEKHLLKNYINISVDNTLKVTYLKNVDLVKFNHDKFAEDGLAYITLEGWDLFYDPILKKYSNDRIIKELSKVIIEECEPVFSSVFTGTLLTFFKKSFSAYEKQGFINKLFSKGILNQGYLNHLADDDIGFSITEIKDYLYELFEKKIYPNITWSAYFKRADNKARYDAAIKLLTKPDLTLLQNQILHIAFNQEGYDKESRKEIHRLKFDIVSTVLDCQEIFTIQQIVKTAFNYEGYDEKSRQKLLKRKYDAAIRILSSKDITLLQQVAHTAFNQGYYDKQSKIKLEKVKYDAALNILTNHDITSLQNQMVTAAFKRKGYDEESIYNIEKAKHEAAIKILNYEDIIWLQHQTADEAFSQRGYDQQSRKDIEKAKYNAAIKIFTSRDESILQKEILTAAYKQKGYNAASNKKIEKEKYKVAIEILKAKDITLFKNQIVTASFKQEGYGIKSRQAIEEAKFKVANTILSANDITKYQNLYQLVVTVFKYEGYDEASRKEIEEIKPISALKILNNPDVTVIHYQIVVAAFKYKSCGKKLRIEIEKAKCEAAIKILSNHDKIPHIQVLIACLKQEGYDDASINELNSVKDKVAINILRDNNYYTKRNRLLILAALSYFSSSDVPSDLVVNQINKIINTFKRNPGIQINRAYYFGLLKIPFHKNVLWKSQCRYIITNWQSCSRLGITCVIYSHSEKKDVIRNLCKMILKSWKSEIFIEISQIIGRSQRGDHIKLALGHPDLKKEAIIAANEMLTEENLKPNTLPDTLLEVVLKIVKEEPEFPDWNNNSEYESNTQQSE